MNNGKKFDILQTDPTFLQEGQLQRLIKKLLKKVFFNNDINGSFRPAKIYQHQDHITCLILCLQFLGKVLDDVRPSNYSASDNLSLVKELKMISVSPVCLKI